jgi:hypothetical protein
VKIKRKGEGKMLNYLLELKAEAERDLLYAQAKIEVANQLIAKANSEETEETDTESCEEATENNFENI